MKSVLLLCLEIPKFTVCYMITVNYIKQIELYIKKNKYSCGRTGQDLVLVKTSSNFELCIW